MHILNTYSKTTSLFFCCFSQDKFLPIQTPSHTQDLFGLGQGYPTVLLKEFSWRSLCLYLFGCSFKVSAEVDWHHFTVSVGEKLSH